MKPIMSEKSIKSDFFKIKLGTLDKKNPSTMYLEAGTYITPVSEIESYKSEIIAIEKEMKLKTRELFNLLSAIDKDFILVTDVAISRLSPERGTHYTVQVHFKPARYQLEMKKTFKQLCTEFVKQYGAALPSYREIIENHGFRCHKSKI